MAAKPKPLNAGSRNCNCRSGRFPVKQLDGDERGFHKNVPSAIIATRFERITVFSTATFGQTPYDDWRVMDPGFDILYENGPCLAICKPPGVLTQAPPGIDSVESRIKRFLKQRDQRTGSIYLGVPHRLDRATSGTMVFAKNRKAARQLSAQFEKRYIAKIYWAIVEGNVTPPTGTWVDQIRKIPGEALAEIVDQDHEVGRRAELAYRVLETDDDVSWLEIELKTGRMHQIRAQSASRGHPVVGDLTYGSVHKLGDESLENRLRPMALHARSLEFRDPTTQQDVTVVAVPPDDWNQFGLSEPLSDDA